MFGALRFISGDGARDFSEHPLRLRPCAESLRSRLVRHDGRKGLTVQVDAPPADGERIQHVLSAFRGRRAGGR